MNLTFVGTGAADWPRDAVFEREAMERGDQRGFTATLLDGHVLIDCGPHAIAEMRLLGIDLGAIHHVLITHSHGDHFCVDAIQELASNRGDGGLCVHGDREALSCLQGLPEIKCCPLSPGTAAAVGNYTVLPLAANHPLPNPAEVPLHYLIEDGMKHLLHATDGAWLLPGTSRQIRTTKLDAIVWDATIGEILDDGRVFEHNSLPMLRLMAAAFRGCGVLAPDTRIFLTHLARTLHDDHRTIAGAYARDGFTVVYDGMRASV